MMPDFRGLIGAVFILAGLALGFGVLIGWLVF
jgi:hypothetical protein